MIDVVRLMAVSQSKKFANFSRNCFEDFPVVLWITGQRFLVNEVNRCCAIAPEE